MFDIQTLTMLDTLTQYFADSGFGQFHWSNGVMIAIGLLFIFLAIRKGFEPLLLVPIGFGMLIGNIPYDASKVALSPYDGPVAEQYLDFYRVIPSRIHMGGQVFELDPEKAQARDPEVFREVWDALQKRLQPQNEFLRTAFEGEHFSDVESIRRLQMWNHERFMQLVANSSRIEFAQIEPIPSHIEGRREAETGFGIVVNHHSVLTARLSVAPNAINFYGQGRHIFAQDLRDDNRYAEVWHLRKQEVGNASVFWWLFAGVGLAGIFPPLIFLGIGAMTDFGPMLANPKTMLLGAAAQFGIFGSLLGAVLLGFSEKQAASIGIIGGADGPTAIFITSQLAPELLGAVALAAYSYMAMVPIIQPPIIKLLTTKKERTIRMTQLKPVSQPVKMMFPVIGFLLTAFLCPAGLPLLGMLFFGNLLRESMVTERLAKTATTSLIDIVTILLGVTVGAKTSAANFLTIETIGIFLLGVLAFALATAAGVIFGKILNALTREPINPMIGAAGVSAVPMAARVVHRLAQEEDRQNFLIMHAMGPNVAGVIGSAVAAGVLLSRLGGY
ncbi:MAG: sodium ion-translocating decarboxylase subunit beta [Phycisphaeraceae bacterium]|nr:sodium ion-translocating decarboxylase subunit beta [Phycisphaeraceae bacterium]